MEGAEEAVARVVKVPESEAEGVVDFDAEIDCVALEEEVPVLLTVVVAEVVAETVEVLDTVAEAVPEVVGETE